MSLERFASEVRELALSFPEAYEESPWGDRVVKVRKKIFAFAGVHEGRFGLTVKLPESGARVLEQPWASPTGYGLGKHGWVSATLQRDTVGRDQILAWLEESYRAVAPKTLIRKLEAEGLKPPEPAPQAEGAPEMVLVGDDSLRLERAVAALAQEGIAAVCASIADETLDLVADAPVRAIVVDLGRNHNAALALAEQIALVADAPVVISGARDERPGAALPRALLVSREAPADAVPALLAELRERRR